MRALASGQSSSLWHLERVQELAWRHGAYFVPAVTGEMAEIPRDQELDGRCVRDLEEGPVSFTGDRMGEMVHETTYTKAREGLASLMDQVTDTREPVLIRRRGREPVALIAADELASWLETAYLLRSPRNARRLLEASERASQGEGETMDLEELRARLGLTEQ